MANNSCWYEPREYGKIECLIENTGIFPTKRGHESVIDGVRQREYKFRTVRECNYIMFRMYGWYYGRDRASWFPLRHHVWQGEIPKGKGDRDPFPFRNIPKGKGV